MQKVQKTYTAEFKREAVQLAQTSGKSIAQVARELGISDTSIHQWRKELTEHGPEAFPGSGHQTAKARGSTLPQARIGNREAGARHPKKSYRHLFARPALKYRFSAEYQHEYPITVRCRVREVSVSGDSAWRKRAPSQHSREDAQLAEKVKVAFQANRRVYGSPRVHAEVRAQGIHCARQRVARLMREQGLFAHRPRHRTVTTKSESGAQVAPNLLQRDFSADQPDKKWVADTTYIWTAEGWLDLAGVLDLFSRMVGRPFKRPLWSYTLSRWLSLVAVQKLGCSITLIVGGPPRARALKHSGTKKACEQA